MDDNLRQALDKATALGYTALANQMANQSAQSAPLRQAVTQQAMNMLPNSAFPGGRPAIPAAVNYPAGTATGGSSSALPTALLSLAGGLGGGLALAPWLQNLFGGGGTNTGGGSGNGPASGQGVPVGGSVDANGNVYDAQGNLLNANGQIVSSASSMGAGGVPQFLGSAGTPDSNAGLDALNTSMGF